MTTFHNFILRKRNTTILILLLTAATILVYSDIYRYLAFSSSKTHIWWLLLGMLAVVPLFFLMERTLEWTAFKSGIRVVIGYYLSFLLCAGFCFLISDIAGLLLSLLFTGTHWSSFFFLITLLSSLVLFLYEIQHTRALKISEYHISTGKSQNSLRVALIGDLHIGEFVRPAHLSKVSETVNAFQPDVILFAGDFFKGDSELRAYPHFDEAAAALRKMRSRYGVYAVAGDCDPKYYDVDFRGFLTQAGIHLLDDASITCGPAFIVGRKSADVTAYQRSPLSILTYQTGKPADKICIVVDHDPAYANEAAEWGADVIVCGHTHTGPAFPFAQLSKTILGEKYIGGRYKIQTTDLIVSSGIGCRRLPLRFTSSEVALITVS